MLNKTITVILPTYNEKDNIIELIKEIDKYIPEQKEILVVDDNSPDGTSQAVQELIAVGNIPGLSLKTRTKDRGLTKSIQEGISLSKGEIVIWLDCDFSHPPKMIPLLLQKIETGYDIAVCSRYIPGGQAKKDIGDASESLLVITLSNILNYLTRMLLFWNFTDYTSGFIAIRKSVLQNIPLRGDYGEYFMDMITRAILRDHKYIEIPFTNEPRKHGETKTGTTFNVIAKRGTKYLWTLTRLFLLKIFCKLLPRKWRKI